jgi:hypothetical protein
LRTLRARAAAIIVSAIAAKPLFFWRAPDTGIAVATMISALPDICPKGEKMLILNVSGLSDAELQRAVSARCTRFGAVAKVKISRSEDGAGYAIALVHAHASPAGADAGHWLLIMLKLDATRDARTRAAAAPARRYPPPDRDARVIHARKKLTGAQSALSIGNRALHQVGRAGHRSYQ